MARRAASRGWKLYLPEKCGMGSPGWTPPALLGPHRAREMRMSANPIAPSVERPSLYTIPPIPTVHDGTRYRSKLEARWAVWFEAMSLRFSYQPSVHLLANRTIYEPDFRLSDFGLWVEIKPFYDVAFMERTRRLALTERPVLTIFGAPGDHEGSAAYQYGPMYACGGRLMQCAAYKTENHRPSFCEGLMLACESMRSPYLVRIGHHNHPRRGFTDFDAAQDRDVSIANRAAMAATFDGACEND